MELYLSHTQAALPPDAIGRALTIGNFDGCHMGHQKLIRAVRIGAQKKGLRSMVITFDPHPKSVFTPKSPPLPLYTIDQRKRLLKEFGIDEVLIQKFDEDFSKISHIEFYERILVQSLRAKHIVIGQDFKFGNKRQGDVDFLTKRSHTNQICIETIERSRSTSEVVSSSKIRQELLSGHLKSAESMLGHPFTLEGYITKGAQLGRTLGFPTANLGPLDQLIPANGVYAAYATIGLDNSPLKIVPSERLNCVINIGLRPTLLESGAAPKIEAHILDTPIGPNALYGCKISLYLVEYLRSEQKFATLEQLKAQIGRDCATARAVLG